METIFSLSSLLVMPFWVLLIFTPNWRWTKRIMGSAWVIAPAALLYLILVLPNIGQIFSGVATPTLAGVTALLGTANGATIGWVHFLAFDLFVGRWIYLDNQEHGLSPWLMGPILFMTLMLGPVGFLLYMSARALRNRL